MTVPILKNHLPQRFSFQSVFAGLTTILIMINLIVQSKEIYELKEKRKQKGYHFFGSHYAGLEHYLKEVKIIGYYTDGNLSEKLSSAKFAQAQLALSPIILDPDNLDHEFIILDCASAKKAVDKMKKIKAVPVVINQAGIILAKKSK